MEPKHQASDPVRLIQITDPHLGFVAGDELLGLNADQSLADVLALVAREQPEPHALVCTGDIASDGNDDSYRRLVACVRRHFRAPLAWLPGNHDDTAVMQRPEVARLAEQRRLCLGDWQLLLLDSSVPGHVYGELADSELQHLERSLAATPDRHTLVMLHHQPVPVGSAWIDQYQLRNAEAFFDIIQRHPQVRGVVWGHVHQTFEQTRGPLSLLATPATSIQFKPDCREFTLDTAMPGYRWFELYSDGRFETGVSRVPEKSYGIDFQSSGY